MGRASCCVVTCPGGRGDDAVTCPGCGEELQIGSWPFCKDGHAPAVPQVIDDTLHGGPRWFDTMGHEDVWIETKSQWKREVAARGLIPVEKHVDNVFGHKKDTSRWI